MTCDATEIGGVAVSLSGAANGETLVIDAGSFANFSFGDGLIVGTSDVAVDPGNGIAIDSFGKVEVDTNAIAGDGLADNLSGQLQVHCGDGLGFSGGELQVEIGEGLQMNNGKVEVTPATSVSHATTGDQGLRDTVNDIIDALKGANLMS